MAAIKTVPLVASLTSQGAAFAPPMLTAKQRLIFLIQAKIVLLNYKGGTNYITNTAQLTKDAELAFYGLTPESWAAASEADSTLDPGAATVGQFVQQANFRDSVNMPATVALIMPLVLLQIARPTQQLQKQNVFLDLELLAQWG